MPEELILPPDADANRPENIALGDQQLPPHPVADSPESRLHQGLAGEVYGKIRDVEEWVLSPSMQQSSETPYVLNSKDGMGFDLTDSIRVQNPAANVNEIIHTRLWESNGMSRTTKVRRIDDKGSFQVSVGIMASRSATTPRVMALTYHAPDAEQGIPGRALFIDSELTGSADQLLSPDDPRGRHVLDNLMVDLNVTHQMAGRVAAARADEAEALKSHERVPLDYAQLVEGNEDIVMFGESHYHTAVMDSIAQNASLLHNAGIRALLIEASGDQDFSDINRGDFARLNAGEAEIGPDLKLMSRKKYEQLGVDPMANARINMIKALTSEGIAIVPVDSARYHDYVKNFVKARNENLPKPEAAVTQAQREQDMAENIDAAVARYGRVAGLVGRAHARKGELINAKREAFRETAQYALDHGHSVRTVHFYGSEFYEGEARKPDPRLTENGWGDQAYMYRPAADDPLATTERGNPDWIVYLPPNKFEYEFAPSRLNEVLR